MKLKKFLIGGLLAMLGFTSVFAIIQPNITGRPLITSANPNNYYTIIQSGTTQGKISMADFANSITGVLGLSGFLTGFTETDPVWMSASGNYLSLSGNTPTTMIDGNVYLDYDNALFIADPADIANNHFNIGYDGYTADIFNRQGPSSYGEFQINGIYPALVSFTGGQTSQVDMSNHGLQYFADYSGAYTNRSLIDKGFADITYVKRSHIDTGFNNTTSDTILPSEKAIVNYIAEFFTGGYFYANGRSSAPVTGDRRSGTSGVNYSVQTYTGGVWVEKGSFTP